MKVRRLTEETRQAILAEYRSGVPATVLQERYGVNGAYVRVLYLRRKLPHFRRPRLPRNSLRVTL